MSEQSIVPIFTLPPAQKQGEPAAPLRFSPVGARAVIDAVRERGTKRGAAAKARVSLTTVSAWLDRGQQDEDQNLTTAFSRFYLDFNEAQQEYVHRRLEAIREMAERTKNAKVLLDVLEREFPEIMARSTVMKGDSGAPVVVEHKLTLTKAAPKPKTPVVTPATKRVAPKDRPSVLDADYTEAED